MESELKQQALKSIVDGQQLLGQASLFIKQANPMAEAVPAVQELDKITRRLKELLMDINRLKGW